MHKNGHDDWCTTCPKGNQIAALRCITEALLSDIGEVTGTALASEWLLTYLSLTTEQRLEFLQVLSAEFGPNRKKVLEATQKWAELGDAQTYVDFRLAIHSPRMETFRRVNRAAGGTLALLELRSLIVDQLPTHPDLAAIDIELAYLFGLWFNRGFLTIERVDWNAPASLLEKMAQYEQVHQVQGWFDMRRRLAEDRRIYGFFHPRLRGEPIIFVEVALTDGMPSSAERLLDVDSPILPRERVTTAVFYSINACQSGLRGVGFGDLLIKQVMEELQKEGFELQLAVTLSPIPRLASTILSAGKPKNPMTLERLDRIIARDAEPLCAAAELSSPREALFKLLAEPLAHREVLTPVLQRLALAHLALARRGKTAHDPVANFHLGNGARIERLNVFADPSPNGLKQSFGTMLNYRYIPELLEENHEAYARRGDVTVSPQLRETLAALRALWD